MQRIIHHLHSGAGNTSHEHCSETHGYFRLVPALYCSTRLGYDAPIVNRCAALMAPPRVESRDDDERVRVDFPFKLEAVIETVTSSIH